MEFPVKTGEPGSQKTACAILPIFESHRLKGPTHEVDISCGGTLSQLVKTGSASARPGRTLLVPNLQSAATDRVLLVGCGKETKFNAKALRQAISAAANALSLTGIKEATS